MLKLAILSLLTLLFPIYASTNVNWNESDVAWVPVFEDVFEASKSFSKKKSVSDKKPFTKKKKPNKRKRIPKWMDVLDGAMDGRLHVGWEPGATIDVIIIDTGCNRNPKSFIPGDIRPGVDEAGHATRILTILDRLVPFANITCFKVFDASGRTSDFSRIVNAVTAVGPYCATKRKCIVNLSVQMSRNDGKTDAAVRELIKKGISVVAAAGNFPNGNSKYDFNRDACNFSPSGAGGGVEVAGATNYEKIVAPFSRIGPCVTEFAPGWNLNLGKWILDGTSFATPIVVARIALDYENFYQGSSQKIAGFDTTLISAYPDLVNQTTRNFSFLI